MNILWNASEIQRHVLLISLTPILVHTRLSLDLFLACSNTSEKTYASVRESILMPFPNTDDPRAKNLVTSAVSAIPDDMCIKGCHAFTGPFAELESCCVRSEPVEYERSFSSATGLYNTYLDRVRINEIRSLASAGPLREFQFMH